MHTTPHRSRQPKVVSDIGIFWTVACTNVISLITAVMLTQAFESIWSAAVGRKRRNGNNEEVCSIVDLQDAINDYLHEGDERTSSSIST